jgi:hypothetical protein
MCNKQSSLSFRMFFPMLMLGLISMTSCLKDWDRLNNVDTFEWDASYGAPLFNGSFSVNDILEQADSLGYLQTNQEGFLSFVARGPEVEVIKLSNEFLFLNDQSKSGTLIFPSPFVQAFNNAPANTTITDSFDIIMDLDYDDLEFDSIFFKAGQFIMSIQSGTGYDLDCTVKIPELIENRVQPFQHSFVNFRTNPNQNHTVSLRNRLANLTIDGTETNVLQVKFIVTIRKLMSSGNMNNGAGFSYTLAIRDQQFQKVIGYFGQQSFEIANAAIDFDLFEKTLERGDIYLEDPKIRLYFRNSFGMGARISNLDQFLGKNAQGQTFPITGIPLPFDIMPAARVGEFMESMLTIGVQNTNLRNVLSNRITSVTLDGTATKNPQGRVKNFATDTSQLYLIPELEIPFYGRLNDIHLTLDAEFIPPANIDIIDRLSLRLLLENEMPIALDFQLYFVDSVAGVVVDSFFSPATMNSRQVVPASTVDNDGKLLQSGKKGQDLVITKALLEKLNNNNVNKITIDIGLNTSNAGNTSVKLFPEYRILVKGGVKVVVKGEGAI